MEIFKSYVGIIFLIGLLTFFGPLTTAGLPDRRFSFKTRLISALIGLVIMIVTGLIMYFSN